MRRSARLAERQAKVDNEAQMEPKAKKKRWNDKTITIQANTMRRSARVAEKKNAKFENDVPKGPKSKKKRLHRKYSNIATLDNGTMVEMFKFLNYSRLAKTSLVSKRFWDVIQTHRHKLAILYVEYIDMARIFYERGPAVIKIFNKEMSSEDYNEWVIRNNHSKQISLKRQAAPDSPHYHLSAYGVCEGPNFNRTSVFSASAELKNETWPLFQYFIRLLTDPFIYIRFLRLIPQTDVFNLLSAAVDPGRDRLQCGEIVLYFEGYTQKLIDWIKDHVRCNKFRTAVSHSSSSRDKQLLDLFATGSDCTSEIQISHCIFLYALLPKVVIIDLVQKLMNLKSGEDCKLVESIDGYVSKLTAKALKTDYEKFFIQEQKDRFGHTTAHTYEFVNADIGKKMQLTMTDYAHRVMMEIINL